MVKLQIETGAGIDCHIKVELFDDGKTLRTTLVTVEAEGEVARRKLMAALADCLNQLAMEQNPHG